MINQAVNRMGSMPIGKLLLNMSLPAITSMLIQSLYNIVDSVFVSIYSNDALSAVTLSFPLQMLVFAFALGVGVGTNSIVARKLGENDKVAVNRSTQTGLLLSLLFSAVFVALGFFIPRSFISGYTDNDTVIQMGTEYLSIVMIFCSGMFVEVLFNKSMQATGNMKVPMISQLIGALVNIVLDPIFIFGMYGLPEMGIKGAAIATVTGQICAMTFSVIMSRKFKDTIKLNLSKFSFKFKTVYQILWVGAPAIVMNAVGSVALLKLNDMLQSYGNDAINVIGVYFKLQSFVFMPVLGLTQGAMPIMGYNYGAGNKARFNKTFLLTLGAAFCIMCLGLTVFQFFPKALLSLFSPTEGMEQIGTVALRRISWSFIAASAGICLSSLFQSIGHGMKSMIMSLLRQIGLLLPAALLLNKYYGLNALWWCFPIAEYTTVLVFLPIAVFTIKKLFKNNKSKSNKDIKIKKFSAETASATTSETAVTEAK